jgi:DNA-binding GntR family transcriptional regulator
MARRVSQPFISRSLVASIAFSTQSKSACEGSIASDAPLIGGPRPAVYFRPMPPRLALGRNRIKLGDQVASHLRDLLVSGEFVAGERLIIEDLASQLEVSAMPVREALIALANEGLIEVLPNRGFRAVAVTRQDVRDVFTLTAITGGMLAERAATTVTPSDLTRLEDIQRRIERAASVQDRKRRFRTIEQLNHQFHETITLSPQAKRLEWFYKSAVRVTPRSEKVDPWIAAQVEDHPGILEALSRRDGLLAKQLAMAHSARVSDMILEYLERSGFWREADKRDPVEAASVSR